MTELENKIAEKILEKMDLQHLIEKIGLDVLTDKIAEKAAEMIINREYPLPPGIIPDNLPEAPWIDKTYPPSIQPITVMYGVQPTEYIITSNNDKATSATTITHKEE